VSRLGRQGFEDYCVCPVDKALRHGDSALGVGQLPGVFGHVYAFKHLRLAPHGYFSVGELDHQVVEVGGAVGGEDHAHPPHPPQPGEFVYHGLYHLLVEVLPGALLREVVVGLVDEDKHGRRRGVPAGSLTALRTPPPKASRRTSPYGSDGDLRK